MAMHHLLVPRHQLAAIVHQALVRVDLGLRVGIALAEAGRGRAVELQLHACVALCGKDVPLAVFGGDQRREGCEEGGNYGGGTHFGWSREES